MDGLISQGGLYIFVRGFRRVYKRRGLRPRELITGIENASKQSTEVVVKIILHLLVCN